jgi:hypothetical protein
MSERDTDTVSGITHSRPPLRHSWAQPKSASPIDTTPFQAGAAYPAPAPHIPLVAEMPQGGYKRSGYGKEMSLYSLEEYTQVKHVMASLE